MKKWALHRISVIIICLLSAISLATAGGHTPYEINVLDILASKMNFYERQNNENITQYDLRKIIEVSDSGQFNDSLVKAGWPPLQESYALVTEHILFIRNGYASKNILIIARKEPLGDGYRTWFSWRKPTYERSVIYRNEDGKYECKRVSETNFEKMLKNTSLATKETFGLKVKKSPIVAWLSWTWLWITSGLGLLAVLGYNYGKYMKARVPVIADNGEIDKQASKMKLKEWHQRWMRGWLASGVIYIVTTIIFAECSYNMRRIATSDLLTWFGLIAVAVLFCSSLFCFRWNKKLAVWGWITCLLVFTIIAFTPVW
jgi:hypothetical protein